MVLKKLNEERRRCPDCSGVLELNENSLKVKSLWSMKPVYAEFYCLKCGSIFSENFEEEE